MNFPISDGNISGLLGGKVLDIIPRTKNFGDKMVLRYSDRHTWNHVLFTADNVQVQGVNLNKVNSAAVYKITNGYIVRCRYPDKSRYPTNQRIEDEFYKDEPIIEVKGAQFVQFRDSSVTRDGDVSVIVQEKEDPLHHVRQE